MKQTQSRLAWVIISAFLAVALALTLPLSAQRDRQVDKKMIENYKRANSHYLKALDFWKKNKPDKARGEADACLKIDEDFSDAHLLLARLDYQNGAFEAALKDVLAAKSGFAAFSSFQSHSYQEYLSRLQADRERKKEMFDGLNNLLAQPGLTAIERSKLQAEANEVNQFLTWADMELHKPIPTAADIPAEYHFVHGNVLFKLRRLAEARDFYQAAVKTDPHHVNAYNNLINLLYVGGDFAEAWKTVQEAELQGVMVNEKLKQAVQEKQPPQ